ncbi:transmembrane protein 69-like [Selaginella moellendorffii]|uniref:transmembrane protein 69-like n=1 Tax=Selaginella moellendorffii TaxID=88036 RepID=UPI000D1CA975|nr:transmembrane protein 69-like [Selaginella moellendorffii]|eukprot:XP_024530013.1 transmembrane protein 69-like [Selaginella moellendorffii]
MRAGHGALNRLQRFLLSRERFFPHSRFLAPAPALEPGISPRVSCFSFSTASNPINSPPAPSQEQGGREEPPRRPPSPASWIRAKLTDLGRDLKLVPPLARSLGLAGAIPFVALSPPIAYVLPLPELLSSIHAADAQAAYGALILSFLGGPHWGVAMASPESSSPVSFSGYTIATVRYVWGVTPCLLGWFAMLLPRSSGLAVLVSSFLLALAVDWAMAARGLLPGWYLPLRMLLTGIAVMSLGSTLLLLLAKDLPRRVESKIEAARKER